MVIPTPNLKIGTCSWNYPSWVGLVYSRKQRTAAEYLAEYAAHFNTVEIDSWFYKIPARKEVAAYSDAVPSGFRFTCKVPNQLTLTHVRGSGSPALTANPDFLSIDLLNVFLETIEPLIDRIDAFMFEFEYLNAGKMASLQVFLDKLEKFFAHAPAKIPYAIEPRNANYLKPPYFDLLRTHGLTHVFSEKQYMPPVYEVYAHNAPLIGNRAIVRLLGGDRAAIEAKTNEQWNQIVEPKADLSSITAMIQAMIEHDTEITVNVNNHYEGSAPLTIKNIEALLSKEK
jgi:uncharacterized protein YecE (DUF72 family)